MVIEVTCSHGHSDSELGKVVFPSHLRALTEQLQESKLLSCQEKGGTIPWTDSQMVNKRDISIAGISSTILSFRLVTIFSSHLSLFSSHPEKKIFTLHWSGTENVAEGQHEIHGELSWTSCCRWELANLGINKQPRFFSLGERATQTCPLVSRWGIDKQFSFPECMLEQMPAPLKPLVDVNGARLSLCGCGSLKTKRGQSVNNSFDGSIDLRQYTHTHT